MTNSGRSATTIKNWGFLLKDRQGAELGLVFGAMHRHDFPQEAVPRPLDANDSVTWYFNRDGLKSTVMVRDGTLLPFADLGDGSRVTADPVIFK